MGFQTNQIVGDPNQNNGEIYIVQIDVGHTTNCVTFYNIEDDIYEILGSKTDPRGGQTYTERLVDYCIKTYKTETERNIE